MLGPDPAVSMAQFEQAILARTFFHPHALLVSESEANTIHGWCLCYPQPDFPSEGSIVAICLSNGADLSSGIDLLEAAESQFRHIGIERVHVGAVCDQQFGLAGLNPIGHGIGIPAQDFRTTSILGERGYSGQRMIQRMTASVSGYRPPVSRDAMQLRRTSQISMVGYAHADERSAAAMSHLDVEMHRLVDRNGTVLARVNLWFSDPEAEVMNPIMTILDLTTLESDQQLTAAESYLIGTAIQSLVARGIAVVETAVESDRLILLDQLRSLQFVSSDFGIVWTKPLDPM